MKLLLDANISWRIIPELKNHFEECLHVDLIDLNIPAKDIEIWEFALIHNLIIVSNDDDFINIMNSKGYPPKVILLKTGNQHNHYIRNILIKHKEDILFLKNDKETGLLEIF